MQFHQMSAIAKLALAATTAVAILAPLAAFAATPTSSTPSCDASERSIENNASDFAARLREQGVNVVSGTDVNDWNGCIQAFVTGANGHQTMMFFDPDTLQEIAY